MDIEKNTTPTKSSSPQVIPISPETPLSPSAPTSGIRALLANLSSFYHENRIYVWASVVGVIILAVLAIFAFRPNKVEQKPAKVDLKIDASDSVPSGGEQVYKVKIANQDSVKLVNVELELTYPDGVEYINSTPKATTLSGTTFPVPDLNPGQNVAVIIKTTVQGEINSEKKVGFILHYKFTNFNSEFVSETTHTVKLVASDVILELSGPESTDNAQVVTYELKYKNNSDETVDNARIEIKYPENFKFADSEPQPNLSKNIWNIGNLNSNQSGTITFRGSFASSTTGQSQTFTANFAVLDKNGEFFTQSTVDFTTSIGSLPLSVSQEITSGATNNIAKPGETLIYKLTYRNNASVPARGSQIAVTLDSNALDLSSIRAEGAQINNTTISWNASSEPNLEVLNPNESGSVSFSVKIKNPPVKDTSKNIEVKSSVKIKSDEYSEFLPGNNLAIKISTLARVETSLEHVGGALPPRVGESSTYRLNISLRNGTNDLRDGILTAFIPVTSGGVDVASIQPAKEVGLVSFDQSTGKLTWKVGALPAHTGDFSPLRKMSIQVRIIPSSSQVGSQPELLKTVSFTATDSFTEQSVNLTGSGLNTGHLQDGGFSNGTVQQ
jgi:hypothetical protein